VPEAGFEHYILSLLVVFSTTVVLGHNLISEKLVPGLAYAENSFKRVRLSMVYFLACFAKKEKKIQYLKRADLN
jgi:hypothetical protein